jgi:hypothetical protein
LIGEGPVAVVDLELQASVATVEKKTTSAVAREAGIDHLGSGVGSQPANILMINIRAGVATAS